MLKISDQVTKVLTLLLVSSLAWGGIITLIAFWIFGASFSVAWTAGIAMMAWILFCIALIGWEFYQAIDPGELKDDEGTEFLEAILLGHAKF